MDEGWTRWVLEQYGFEYVTLRPADFKSPLTGKVDVVILADDARLPIEGAAGGRGGGWSGEAAARSVPSTPTGCRRRTSRRFEQFVRGGGTLICLNTASTFAIQQFKLPVKNVVAGLGPDEFFLRGIDRRSHDRSGAPGDGRHAGEGGGVRRQQPGVRDAGGIQGDGAREIPGHAARRCCPATSSARSTCTARRRRSTCSSMPGTSSCSASGPSGAASRSARSRSCSTRLYSAAEAGDHEDAKARRRTKTNQPRRLGGSEASAHEDAERVAAALRRSREENG